MKYLIKDIVGENCITLEDGQRLFGQISSELKKGNKVELDFNGVIIFASPFFNSGIGQLLETISFKELTELLRILNLEPSGHEVLDRVISNSIEYYSNPAYRESLNKIIEDPSRDR